MENIKGKFLDDDGWKVFQEFANEYGFLSHQIESFNEFISHTLQQIIEKDPEVNYENHTVLIANPIIESPSHREMDDTIADLYPSGSMKRDIPYNSKLYADITIKTPTKDCAEFLVRDYKSVNIGAIPVIVDSVICNRSKIKNDELKMAKFEEDVYCNGGFFITKGGASKIISGQQQTASNQIYVFMKRNKPPKFDYFSEVRSTNTGFKSTTTRVGIKGGIISVHVPYIEGISIPLGILFCALGTTNLKEMVKYIYPDTKNNAVLRILTSTFETSYMCKTQDDALYYIGSRGKKKLVEEGSKTNVISYAKHLLSSELLPHVGSTENSFNLKKFYIGHMAAELIDTVIKKRNHEDRDHYGIKINANIGILFSQLFHTAYKKFRKEIVKNIEKCVKQNEFINIQTIIKPSIIKNVMSNALTNSAWGGAKKTPGISQPYDRFNYGASLANARKLMTTINTEGGKIEAPRQLHGSHFRVACPSDTPEGKKCGLIGNLSLGAILSTGCNKEEVIEILKHEFDIHSVDKVFNNENEFSQILHATKIFINGYPLGFISNPKEVVDKMKLLRRRGDLLFEISIILSQDLKMLHIRTDPGRFLSPLLIVENGSIKLTQDDLKLIKLENTPGSVWTKLLTKGYVEFLSKAEEESALIAMYPSDIQEMALSERKFISYCEINPCLMFGIGASQVPHSDSNQAPRNSYQAAMGKQSIGIPGANCLIQTKTKMYIMNYPQLPLIRTKPTDILKISELPSGQNAMVAVCPWYGFGQEDSIIINQDSIDRGMFDVTVLMPFIAKIKKDKDERIEIPKEEECDNFRGMPSKLNILTGIVDIGQKIVKGDILIGITVKMDPSGTIQGKRKHSISVIYDQKRPGIVHNIDHGTDGDGYEYVRVVIAQLRKPSVGDKFSSTHAQKGTMSITYRSIDLPFDQEGISPDVIINPLAFPSRMTVGMTIEMMSGRKVCSSSFLNAITFKKPLNINYCPDSPDITSSDIKSLDIVQDKPFEKINYSDFSSCTDGTPFKKEFTVHDIINELTSLGINGFCDEAMTNGQTGETMTCLIFNGVCTYQRLKHMTEDKIHSRGEGGRTRITRQPKEGRKQGGGFRVGVMEKDVIMGQGCAYFAKDRLLDQSDRTEEWFCRVCGLQAIATAGNPKSGIPPIRECRVCGTNKVVLIEFTYATKLAIQELLGMNIAMRLILTKFESELIAGNKVVVAGGKKKLKGVIKKIE